MTGRHPAVLSGASSVTPEGRPAFFLFLSFLFFPDNPGPGLTPRRGVGGVSDGSFVTSIGLVLGAWGCIASFVFRKAVGQGGSEAQWSGPASGPGCLGCRVNPARLALTGWGGVHTQHLSGTFPEHEQEHPHSAYGETRAQRCQVSSSRPRGGSIQPWCAGPTRLGARMSSR